MVNMSEKRIYPRIDSDWPLFFITDDGQKQIGYVKNISLSGASLVFTKEYSLIPEKHNFTLRLRNPQLEPSELSIAGLKKWTKIEKNVVYLGLVLEELEKGKKSAFVRFLSRSDKLHVEAILIEND